MKVFINAGILYLYLNTLPRMRLREARWRKHYDIPPRLPRVHRRFLSSLTWQKQKQVLENDLIRMPPMCHENVMLITRRFASTFPYAGYTQGNLYIMYVVGLVFSDELSVYWAFAKTVHRVHRYGPATPYGTRMIPQWVIDLAPPIDPCLCDIIIRFRWMYILFGQTFVGHENILAAWDFCMHGDHHMVCLCAALLVRGTRTIMPDPSTCNLEYMNDIVSQSVSSIKDTAQLISEAQLFL